MNEVKFKLKKKNRKKPTVYTVLALPKCGSSGNMLYLTDLHTTSHSSLAQCLPPICFAQQCGNKKRWALISVQPQSSRFNRHLLHAHWLFIVDEHGGLTRIPRVQLEEITFRVLAISSSPFQCSQPS